MLAHAMICCMHAHLLHVYIGAWPNQYALRTCKHFSCGHGNLSIVIECNRFGGERFSYNRMSWIKPNFLWMMYRSGWATKRNQEKILAVWILRTGFEEILSHALTGRQEKERGMDGKSQVRLQWDPDHDPHGVSQQRRAIQLGLRDEVMGVLNLATGKHLLIMVAP